MKIKGFLFFVTGTVVSMLCMPVLADDSSGVDLTSLLANLDVQALIAAAPTVASAIAESALLVAAALPQIIAVVAENGLDFEATFSALTEIVGELVINIVAVAGAAFTNVLLAAGLLPTLNEFLGSFLATLDDPVDVTFAVNTSKQVLKSGVTVDTCTSTSYKYNISEAMIGGFTDLQITELTINDQTYEDNLFDGDIDFAVGGFDLETVLYGSVSEDKCGEMSDEEYDFSYKMMDFELKSNIRILGIVEGKNFTLKNLTIGETSINSDSESSTLSSLSFPVEDDLKDALVAEIDVFKDYIDDGEFLNDMIQEEGYIPFTIELPFEWPL